MQRCPACHHDFPVRSGSVIPYRCPHCVKLVLGPYCDLEWIGGGGMGDVYRAIEPGMGDRTVAIKIPKTDFDADRAKRRFEREIAASARLQHENAVRAYHRGEEGGRSYLVMEFVCGRKLSELVRPDSPLAPQHAAKILLGVARGLRHGAQVGVVNRDIKPDNLLLAEPDDTPKILDYGLALITAVDEQVTRSGSMLGTPNYVAPEQARDPHGVTIAADVYSLGSTALFCLTGYPPFRAGEVDEVLRLHAEAPRPSVRMLRPDVSEGFDRLIQAMMSIMPGERPGPREVIDALRAMLPGLSDERARPVGEPEGRRIDAECPQCGTSYHLLASSAGKPIECPNKLCGATFTVPLPPPEPPEVVDAEIADPDSLGGSPPPLPTRPFGGALSCPTDGTPSPVEAVGTSFVEAEIADVRASDVDELPSHAVVRGPLAEEPSGAVGAKPTGRRPKAKRRKRQRGIPWLAVMIVGALVVGILLLIPHVRWDFILPRPEARWTHVMELFDQKKWDRAERELDRFEEAFPDSHHVEEIPFFSDMCKAGHDVYSPTGNADRGLERLEQIFRRHRDNPAYSAYCGRLYQALARLVTRFAGAAVLDPQPGLVAQARKAHDLLTTVGQAIGDDGVPERTAALALSIEHAESAVDLALARRAASDWLQQAKSPSPDVDPDAIYAEIDKILAEYRTLADRLERLPGRLAGSGEEAAAFLADLYVYYNGAGLDEEIYRTISGVRKAEEDARAELIVAYGAEPGRIRFLPEPADSPSLPPAAEEVRRRRQGTMLVVVWGDSPNEVRVWNEWNHRKALSEQRSPPERKEVFFALARGILHAFDPAGTLLWARRLGVDSHRLPGRIDTPQPLRIAVSTEDNTLLALEEFTGQVRWKYPVGQDIVAPLAIVERTVAPEAPGRHCGLLPTADGEIHVLELVLGKPLGRYQVGHPLTVGGAYDRRTGVVFFPADATRIFAIDPAAVDDPHRPACRGVLFTNHSSGALRCEPAVIGRYLIVSEASELEHTRLRAFEIRESGLLDPTAVPCEEVALEGWTWFEPHSTPDRLTLITDRGHLGIFGLNLDNPDEALYRIVPDWNTNRPAPFRALAVDAQEHLLWIMAGGVLEQLAVDVVRQEVRSVWQRSTASLSLAGFPVHKAQMDRFATRFFLATMSESGRVFQLTAVDSESGNRLWGRQLGLNLLGDPLVWEDGAMLIDRSGRTVTVRSDSYWAGGEALPEGADDSQLMRLGNTPQPTHLCVPLDGGTRLAICRVELDRPAPGPTWTTLKLPDPLNGRPCVCGDFLVVPCSDGLLYHIRWKGDGENGNRPLSFGTGSNNRLDLVSLSSEAILLIDGRRHLRRLEFRTEDAWTRWDEIGSEFEPHGDETRFAGRPLVVLDRLFVFDTEGTLYCLEADDPGRCLASWPLSLSVTRGPVLRDGRLVAVVGDRRLICLAAEARSEVEQPLWISEPFGGRIRGMPVLAGDTLLVADNSRQLTGIRLADGEKVWSVRLRTSLGPSATPVPCADGKMLVPLSDGTLEVMQIPSPQPAETEQ